MKLRKLVLAITTFAALGIVGPALAASESFSFGDLFAGQKGPDNSSIWGTLTVATQTSNTYLFTLTLDSTNFSSLFGAGAYVSEAIFNTPSGLDPISAAISGSGGVSSVKLVTNAPTLGLGFDFGDCFGTGSKSCSHGSASGRLQAGESVAWTTRFATSQGDPMVFSTPPVGLHVQSISTFAYSDSAWYGPANPVPEPEIYAMMAAGLGLMGFVARRRKQMAVE